MAISLHVIDYLHRKLYGHDTENSSPLMWGNITENGPLLPKLTSVRTSITLSVR